MKTSKQCEEEFRKDLAELLAKHNAELTMTDDGRPWGMHSGICIVTMYGKYDEEGNALEEGASFNL